MQLLNGRQIRATVGTNQAPTLYKPQPGERAEEKLVTKGVTIAFAHPTPDVSWKCADAGDPEMFHPTDQETLQDAAAFCDDCPVRALCLELGVAREEFGVWGGVLLESGKPLPAVRRPGRPKKVLEVAVA